MQWMYYCHQTKRSQQPSLITDSCRTHSGQLGTAYGSYAPPPDLTHMQQTHSLTITIPLPQAPPLTITTQVGSTNHPCSCQHCSDHPLLSSSRCWLQALRLSERLHQGHWL